MEAIVKIFTRDLRKLSSEIEHFERQEDLWKTPGDISNSAGNLCLHLAGNLNHFVGAVIGGSAYVRDREAEFTKKGVDQDELIDLVVETEKMVVATLSAFETKRLKTTYPIRVFGEDMSYEFFLVHLTTHLNYHLGQINYLRRILQN